MTRYEGVPISCYGTRKLMVFFASYRRAMDRNIILGPEVRCPNRTNICRCVNYDMEEFHSTIWSCTNIFVRKKEKYGFLWFISCCNAAGYYGGYIGRMLVPYQDMHIGKQRDGNIPFYDMAVYQYPGTVRGKLCFSSLHIVVDWNSRISWVIAWNSIQRSEERLSDN